MKRLLIFILSITIGFTLLGQNSFEFDGKSIVPGTKEHFTITIQDGENQTFIPITVFHGKSPGPVLGITAGVHGYEYAPILASQKLIHNINLEELKGTIILVQVANIESFRGRSPYLNPVDGKNLNRSFPGNPNGTLTERIADYISKDIFSRIDFFVDMHSGDAPEDLKHYNAYYHHDDRPEQSAKSRNMAINMGFDHIIVFDATQQDYLKNDFPSLYCSAEAFKQGIPAVDIECGRLGIIEDQLVDHIVSGIHSLLRHLEMLEGQVISTPGLQVIRKRKSQSSSHAGIFYPLKAGGDYVKKGMKLGYTTDFFGRTIEEVFAETSGVILYMLGTPPINKGETIVSIGIVE